MPKTTHQRGLTLVETVITITLLGLTSAITLPHLADARRHAALTTVAAKVGGLLYQCRAHAVFHRTATGLVFTRTEDGPWSCHLAEDGDGDGIHSDDLEAGRDRIIGEVLELDTGGAGLGILSGVDVPDPAGDGLLGGDLTDPIRAGSGNIITFTPRGTASSSSIYLTDHRSRMKVLRVLGVTGRPRSMEWKVGWNEWKRSGV